MLSWKIQTQRGVLLSSSSSSLRFSHPSPPPLRFSSFSPLAVPIERGSPCPPGRPCIDFWPMEYRDTLRLPPVVLLFLFLSPSGCPSRSTRASSFPPSPIQFHTSAPCSPPHIYHERTLSGGTSERTPRMYKPIPISFILYTAATYTRTSARRYCTYSAHPLFACSRS